MHPSEQTSKPVTCPYCGTNETELFALFGQQLLTVQYYCRTCHTPFEAIKDDDLCDERAVAHISDPPPRG
ncbi:MAG TPA: hypothetical protein VGF67_19590 [Ktedonobacteraceae bacterium]|jgi:DNA-directed RNA polymerase subunit RPC12/RpoP